MYLRKDKSLDELAEVGNVAQFISYAPEGGSPAQAYCRLLGQQPNRSFESLEEGLASLLSSSSDRSINVRSYSPENPRSREFLYGLQDVAIAAEHVRRLTSEGLHTIANETIDIHDGGVSGVVQGNVIEFAPDDTPRCVEKSGVASLPTEIGLCMLEVVYGFRPEVGDTSSRIEFSIHPKPRGWRGTHTLLWESEPGGDACTSAAGAWPNLFSRHIGDKTFGLLMAHLAGFDVPFTQCIARRVAPFSFGRATGSYETWIRTCPKQQEPGLFTTHRGWLDPFQLMANEDPAGDRIAAILAQQGVRAAYSGASIVSASGRLVVEGVVGGGDSFMLGSRTPETLPRFVETAVRELNERLAAAFGPVRTEWVHDGERVWLVQLHKGATVSDSHVLVPGERQTWVPFEVTRGLEELRSLIDTIDANAGLRLQGQVGLTSHIADLVRKAGVPTRIVAAA